MKLLLDTHLLLWAAGVPERLSPDAMRLLCDSSSKLHFSAASIWEVVIKSTIGRTDFRVVPSQLRDGLVQNDYTEIPIHSDHALSLIKLPNIHRDPFDRILVAQAMVEKAILVTTDSEVAKYPGPIRLV
ncbi:MAG: type II toxin-antitoxin system VapC family toxin [Gammaproteobacteria bacterium]|nr:type II toxin-antitoxin system VapC family toxin [Gammaproteobacteria bacterium]